MTRRIGMLLLLTAFWTACSHPPDVDAVRAAIRAMAVAAEERSNSGVLDYVADDFVGNDGELDRAGLERLLRTRLLAGAHIGVSIGTIDVEVSADRATARFDATLTDGSGRWLPERRTVLAMVTGWRREGRDWRCYNARWSGEAR